MAILKLPQGYKIAFVRPPGPSIVSPEGFPTPPLPPHAPALFLDAMAVRLAVFCDEQKCSPVAELDEDDPRSWSWVIYNASQTPVATVRLVPPPHGGHPNGYVDPEEEPYVKLTRLATVEGERGKGLGKVLFEVALEWVGGNVREVGGGWKGMVLLHAQTSVESMYTRMGFVTDEKLGRWDEEGIEHLGMWKRVVITRSKGVGEG